MFQRCYDVVMRVVAGNLNGRSFKSPRGRRSHPMSEKVRGALFNALGDMAGLDVLDAFGGSGALAFEAVSRGADHAQVVESDVRAYKTIKDNIESLDVEQKVKATRANVSSWSDNNRDRQFDVVLVDPPYDDIRPDLIEKLVRHVKEGGLYVLSWPGSEEAPTLKGLKQVKNNKYGDSQLVFYAKTG